MIILKLKLAKNIIYEIKRGSQKELFTLPLIRGIQWSIYKNARLEKLCIKKRFGLEARILIY